MEELIKKLENVKVTKITEIKDLECKEGLIVKIRGFVDSARGMSKAVFYVIRDRLETVQCIYGLPGDASEEVKNEFKKLKKLSIESFVEITGEIKKVDREITKCSKKTFEIEVLTLEIIGAVYDKLPFSPKDAASKESNDPKRPTVGYNVRLDNRFLDFRVPATFAMVKILDQTMNSFRDYLRKQDFIEIKTSKIIQSGSEGGANLFSVNYFDKTAYLAQSPQLYKQLAILGGLKRVCEVGHVYRAEVSNINRYLSEFTGLDIEMELEGNYIDFIHFVHKMFLSIFNNLNTVTKKEIEVIREYCHFEDLKIKSDPVIYKHRECVDMLKEKGIKMDYCDDFSREQEKILGQMVKEKDNVDIFTVIDYPMEVRAFYTFLDPETGMTRSYDFIIRGEEILSGAQRETNYEKLTKAVDSKGISLESLKSYLDPFKFGAPPHIGCGIGLERLLKAFFGFDDIRYFSLFPRDPNRLTP